jgi:hypothetical protein
LSVTPQKLVTVLSSRAIRCRATPKDIVYHINRIAHIGKTIAIDVSRPEGSRRRAALEDIIDNINGVGYVGGSVAVGVPANHVTGVADAVGI